MEYTNEQLAAFPVSPLELAEKSMRQERNARLSKSDIYVLPDRWDAYTDIEKAAWSDYRQALRDIPQNTTNPHNPQWPIAPNEVIEPQPDGTP